MCQGHSTRLLISRIEDKHILQLSDHIVDVRVDQTIEFIRTKPEPRHGLQEAIRAPIRASAGHHKLPELEADNLRIFAWPTKLADKIRSSNTRFHVLPHLWKISCAIDCATGLWAAKKRK